MIFLKTYIFFKSVLELSHWRDKVSVHIELGDKMSQHLVIVSGNEEAPLVEVFETEEAAINTFDAWKFVLMGGETLSRFAVGSTTQAKLVEKVVSE